jgi:diguanylate cyclase (GGDEF)-like protein
VLLALFIFALTRLQVVHGKLKRALVTQQRLARTDPLTHCPNRYALETIAPNLLAQAGRRNEWVAVGLFDLNDFKPVNDRFGHDVGDALLVTVAERLKAATRTSDFVARLGGDEFVILLTGLTAQGAYAELTAFGERLLRHFAEPFTVGGTTLPISYGIGWALFPQHGEELDTLLRRADEALLALKAQKGQTSETMRIAGEANASFTETAPTIDDPFGPAARQLLAAYTALLQDAAERLTETLLSEITEHPAIGKRLAAQLPDAFAHYRALVAAISSRCLPLKPRIRRSLNKQRCWERSTRSKV